MKIMGIALFVGMAVGLCWGQEALAREAMSGYGSGMSGYMDLGDSPMDPSYLQYVGKYKGRRDQSKPIIRETSDKLNL